ncbi:hypothetical protein BASA81_014453 [Batrachochytrium salamandrivorans]|nr:hypothetical protein BASA81_014453 [Batrachochytrium salamandrivorans]
MLSKGDPLTNSWLNAQPEFRKAGAAAWLALKRETSVPAHSAQNPLKAWIPRSEAADKDKPRCYFVVCRKKTGHDQPTQS